MSGPAEIRPCKECGRPTRDGRMAIANAPGTVVRKGGLCTTCADRRLRGQFVGQLRLSDAPLTGDERLVLRAIAKKCGDDAAEVAAMLGLTREEVPA